MTQAQATCEFCRLISKYTISKFCYDIDIPFDYEKAVQFYRYVKLYQSTCATKDDTVISCLIQDRK